MKCYEMTGVAADNAVTLSEERFLNVIEADLAQETAARAAAALWSINYYEHFLCVADSDNGIDDSRITMEKTIAVTPEMVVLKDGVAIGVYLDGWLFEFADETTHYRKVILKEGWVGGWGDVTETAIWKLKAVEE